jgi:hypothetical protein
MRHLILLTLLLACASVCAQTEDAPPTNRQLLKGEWHIDPGVNITNLLLRVTRNRPDSGNLNPYLLSLRVSKGAWGLRASVGGTHRRSLNSVAGYADSEEINSEGIELKTGIDYHHKLSKRFEANYGADYVLSWQNIRQITDSGYDVVDRWDQTTLHGFGISSGLTYWITPRVGLMTEVNFQMVSGYRDRARKFKNFPELDDQLLTEQISVVRKSILGGLFLMYRF